MQIRVHKEKEGRVRVTFRPNRPGETRATVLADAPLESLKDVLSEGVRRMRAQTRFGFPEGPHTPA